MGGRTGALALLVALALAAPAGAATTLGFAAPNGTTEASCDPTFTACSTWLQFDQSPGSVVPEPGVITEWTVGRGTTAGDTAALLVFRPVPMSAVSFTLISKSAPVAIPASGFFPAQSARAAIRPGDRLGIQITGSGNVAPHHAVGGAAYSVARIPASAAVGANSTLVEATDGRLNLSARFEPDRDADGYGDDSQDLCLDSPIATQACTGTLVGSPLQFRSNAGTACPTPCTAVQMTIGTAPTVVPQDGVLVRWRVKNPTNEVLQALQVLRPDGAGFRAIATTEPLSVSSSSLGIQRRDVRVPVLAGDVLGLHLPGPGTNLTFATDAPGEWRRITPAPTGGAIGVPGGPSSGELLFDADLEPDADRDGFGDISQDGCPSDASAFGACPPPAPPAGEPPAGPAPPPPGPGPVPPAADRTAPALSAVKLTSRRLLRLRLSEAATLAIRIERARRGVRRAGRCTAGKPRRGTRRCRRHSRVAALTRVVVAGTNRAPLGARLRPGKYRLRLIAVDAAGNRSRPVFVAFAVRKR